MPEPLAVLPAVVVAVAPARPVASVAVAVPMACPDARVAAPVDWFGKISGVFVRSGGNNKLQANNIIQTSRRVTDRPK